MPKLGCNFPSRLVYGLDNPCPTIERRTMKKWDIQITLNGVNLGMGAFGNDKTDPAFRALTVIIDNVLSRHVIGTHVARHGCHDHTIL
jgi:hypothetical protein